MASTWKTRARRIAPVAVPLVSFLFAAAFVFGCPLWPGDRGWLNLARGCAVAASLVFLLALFHAAVVRAQTAVAEWAKNVLCLVFSVAAILLLLEGVFTFLPRSHGVQSAYAAENWFRYYWKPINALGYRDREVREEDLKGRKVIAVVGDSLAAGYGIADIEDRFSAVLQESAGARCAVLTVALIGANTKDEYAMLASFPHRPDLVVLQYYGNDIMDDPSRRGQGKPEGGRRPRGEIRDPRLYRNLPASLRFVVRRSYLANYLYWLRPAEAFATMQRAILARFDDPEILARHLGDLERFVAYSRDEGIPLLVVVFPVLQDIEGSKGYVAEVQKFFSSRSVPILDVADLVRDLPAKKCVVNRHDSHPSLLVHRRVGEELHRRLVSSGLLAPARAPD